MGAKKMESIGVITTWHPKKRKTFHLSISILNKISHILSSNLSSVQACTVIAFYEPSLTNFIYERRYNPHPFLKDPLWGYQKVRYTKAG